jgi:hypothetical protein
MSGFRPLFYVDRPFNFCFYNVMFFTRREVGVMIVKLFWVGLISLLLLAGISALLGWLPSRADLSFLVITPLTVGTGIYWFRFSTKWDRSNDPLVSAFIHFTLFHSLFWITILTPLIVWITSMDWVIVTIVGVVLAWCAEAVATLQLRF